VLPILASVVVISLSGILIPGPMFALTVVKSYRSPWAGVWIALGHAMIEVPLILLIYFGLARFFENTTVQLVLSLLGGGVIIWMGIAMFRVRAEVVQRGEDLPYSSLVTGIVTSGLNPYFFLWWATVGLMLVMRFLEFGIPGLIILVIVHWSCDLVWLSLVSNVVYRTHSLWGLKFQERMFIICSFLLIGFGGWFIFSGIRLVI